jgi:hypothetical protein
MRLLDLLAAGLVLASAGAFLRGAGALARTDDLSALYWLGVGIAALRAGVQLAKPGAA